MKRICNIFFIAVLLMGCESSNSDAVDTKITPIESVPKSDSIKLRIINDSNSSEITCPDCKHTEIEKLPTEICLLKYKCKNCFKEIVPKQGDCCVFCSYGTVKCPSKQ